MTERIRFTVTQRHIDRGSPDNTTGCPVALALQDLGAVRVCVGTTDVELARIRGDAPVVMTLDRATREFVEAFDRNRPVAPFTGEVYR